MEMEIGFLIILAAICTGIGFDMGKKRTIGSIGGALLGFFLGIVGLLILLFIPKKDIDSALSKTISSKVSSRVNDIDQEDKFKSNSNSISVDELKKWHDLLKSGAITEEEYQQQKQKLLSN